MSFRSYKLIENAPPGAEPLALDEMKAHLRVEHDADDALLLALVAAARQACEAFTGRALVTRPCSLWMDAWPEDGIVAVPLPPLRSVAAVNIYDEDGAGTVFPAASYYADAAGSRVVLAAGAAAPAPGRAASGIEIVFSAGYGAAPQDVPEVLRQGMKQVVAQLYGDRGEGRGDAVIRSGAAGLFAPYRVLGL